MLLNRSLITTIILFVLAIVFLGVETILKHISTPEIIAEIINIAGWVFAWEAIYELFLHRQTIRIQRKHEIALMNSKIEFYPLKDM